MEESHLCEDLETPTWSKELSLRMIKSAYIFNENIKWSVEKKWKYRRFTSY
jgi:hypothetical protein